MNQIDKVLAERGNRYGDFTDHAKIAQALQQTMHGGINGISRTNWYKLDDVQRQALTVIADKIARILSGDPNYDDNWIDIQGYAKLAQDRLPKQGELFKDDRQQPLPQTFKASYGATARQVQETQRGLSPIAIRTSEYSSGTAGGFMYPTNCD